MNIVHIALLIGGGYLILNSSKKSSRTTLQKTEPNKTDEKIPPKTENSPKTPPKGYEFVNCENIEEKNMLETINYAKYVGANFESDKWDMQFFGNCNTPVDYLTNTSLAYFSFNLYKYACGSAVELGKMSKDEALNILLKFRETAYDAGIEESETWIVEYET